MSMERRKTLSQARRDMIPFLPQRTEQKFSKPHEDPVQAGSGYWGISGERTQIQGYMGLVQGD